MGFRSTFTTECYSIEWPDWFVEKYKEWVHFPGDRKGSISSSTEGKTYGIFEDLHSDIQKVIDWEWLSPLNFVLVYLHECGGITRCQIERDRIVWSEPDGWRETDGVCHDYCYGCSDAPTTHPNAPKNRKSGARDRA